MADVQKREKTKTSAEGRDTALLSAIAHASIVAVFIMGPLTLIVPLVIWLSERNRPKPTGDVIFHARQAFFFQAAVYIVTLAAGLVAGLLTLIFIGLLLIPFVLAFFLGAVIYGVYGGVQVWQGRPFRYRHVTDFIEKNFH
ncbi:DUF4870 domain-containing protein [bacterium]|nr:DUF4870 domain-containing protein [bacterium]